MRRTALSAASLLRQSVSQTSCSGVRSLASESTPVTATLFPGDGIGPEIAVAVQKIFTAAEVPVQWDEQHVGTSVDPRTNSFVTRENLDSVLKHKVGLKGPMATPIGKGHRSLNLTLRKELQLYANVRPCFSIPGYKTRYDNVNLVTIRENTEGEYSGLEHEVVPDVVESLKVITSEKSRRVAEYAFGFAFLNNRKKVTAVHKANIMKLSDGAFLKEFREVAKQYPSIKSEEMIVDNTCMQLTGRPDQFDIMVTPNLYGNIVANVVAGLTGGPGIMPGANVGNHVAVFEQGARHVGQDIAGQNIANPTAALLSTAMLLRHCNLPDFSDRIHKAVTHVINSGPESSKTVDIGGTATTTQFTDAVIAQL